MILSTVGTTRLQNGHWKSENSTMVTLALAGPREGPSSATRTRSTPSPGPWAVGMAAVASVELLSLSRVARRPRPYPPPSTTSNNANTVPLFMICSIPKVEKPRDENQAPARGAARPTRASNRKDLELRLEPGSDAGWSIRWCEHAGGRRPRRDVCEVAGARRDEPGEREQRQWLQIGPRQMADVVRTAGAEGAPAVGAARRRRQRSRRLLAVGEARDAVPEVERGLAALAAGDGEGRGRLGRRRAVDLRRGG